MERYGLYRLGSSVTSTTTDSHAFFFFTEPQQTPQKHGVTK